MVTASRKISLFRIHRVYIISKKWTKINIIKRNILTLLMAINTSISPTKDIVKGNPAFARANKIK